MADEKSKPEQIETVGGSGRLEPTVAGVDPPPSPGSDDAALPVVSPDHYAREGEVARGGMGRIVAARDRRLGRAVALKELHQESASSARRFVREALVTARLQHPSIVPVYEAGRWPEGVPFYAMKMVSGRSLDAVIRSTPTLAGRLALLPHVIAVAEAIAYAHSERIIHRDLKPANVLVGSFGETVVVDWGLAKDLSRPAGDEPRAERLPVVSGTDATIVGTVLGTPHYMPPEQARGEGVDERADVYALGAILYYLMTGAPPHAGKTATEALAAVASGPPEPVEEKEPNVPQELAAIVRKAMARDAARRYPTARELAADLQRFVTGQLVSVHQYSSLELLRRWVARNRAAVSVAAVLTLGLIASLTAGIIGVRREAKVAAEERDKARLEAKKAEQINAFVQKMLGSADPRAGGREVTVVQVLEDASRRAAVELRSEPEIQAAVQLTLASTYEGLGLYDAAEAQARAALETRRRVLGQSHPDVARALVQLSGAINGKGDFAAAEALCREALRMYEAMGLDEGLDGALAMSHLGSALQVLGRFDEAERFHRQALAIDRRLLGSDDARIATSLNNVGVVLGQKGKWAQAEPLHREALAIMRRVRGPEHIEVAAAMRTLATVLESQDKFDEAEGLFREAAAMCRKLLGPEHPDTAWTLYNHAFLLRRKGDPQGAAEKAREVLVLRGRSLNESHPVVAAAEQVVALSLIDLGRPKEAEPLLRDSLALRRRALPAGHWLIATAEGALGVCLTRLRRFADAESSLLSSYASLRAAHGEQHERTAEARQRLVALYEAWGKPQKATPYRTTAVKEERPSADAGL